LESDWKAVKSQACDLESKGQLQAAVSLVDEAIKQSKQPLDEMLQCDLLSHPCESPLISTSVLAH
jgi:hypothetical protein